MTWGEAVGDVNNDGLLDLVSATGGAVVGGGPAKPQQKTAADKSAKKQDGKASKEAVPELPLPRMQVWINEGVK